MLARPTSVYNYKMSSPDLKDSPLVGAVEGGGIPYPAMAMFLTWVLFFQIRLSYNLSLVAILDNNNNHFM